MRHRTPWHRHLLAGGAAALSLSLLLAAPLGAQSPVTSPAATTGPTEPPAHLTVTTTYPSIEVDPGGQATFPLSVTSPRPERVDLVVHQVPEGFTTTLRGGGSIVSSVFTGGETPPELELQVDVPEGTAPAKYSVVVTATSATETVELPLDLVVADATGGDVTLTTDYPSLRGDSSASFAFNLKLTNSTPQEVTFGLEGIAPDGWDVTVQPSGQSQANTAVVGAGKSQNITATVTPARLAAAGQYPVLVTATGDAHRADVQLAVELTGSYDATLTTPDGRLNMTATAGDSSTFAVVIENTGTADLVGITLSASPPNGWTVAWDSETVEPIPVGGSYTGTASITPAADAIAGDYIITMSARSDDVSESISVRTTVETSSMWGFVGIGLIVLVLVGLVLVFRRYGRR